MARVFFSYDHRDRDKVERVQAALEAKDHEIWLDTQEIRVGTNIPHAIQIGINNCDYFAIFLTAHAAKSQWVKTELSTFIMRDVTEKGDRILPLRFEDCEISDFPHLTHRSFADFSEDFDAGIRKLLEVLDSAPHTNGGVSRADYERLIFAIDLAVRSGTTAMLYYNSSLKENLTLDQRKNAATDADRTAQVQVVSQIMATNDYKMDTIISEEKPFCHAQVDPDGYTWVIDPLDGTSNFWNRVPLFCSAIGVLREGKPFIGTLFDPIANEVYYAVEGQPSQVWRMTTGESSFIVADQRTTDPSQALLGTHISSRPKIAKKMFESGALFSLAREFKHIRVLGCGQLALAYVATGRLQAFFQFGSYLWDQVAGVVIVRNAGGYVYNAKRTLPDWTHRTTDILAVSNRSVGRGFQKVVWPSRRTDTTFESPTRHSKGRGKPRG